MCRVVDASRFSEPLLTCNCSHSHTWHRSALILLPRVVSYGLVARWIVTGGTHTGWHLMTRNCRHCMYMWQELKLGCVRSWVPRITEESTRKPQKKKMAIKCRAFATKVHTYNVKPCRIQKTKRIGLHMGPNNLRYVTRHFLVFPYVAMSLL